MNDFETVRESLGHGFADETYAEANAALERLTKTLREWREGYPGELIAEVERLQAESDAARDAAATEHAELTRLRDEVERLRLREGALLNVHEENERLRNGEYEQRMRAVHAEDERERLRAALEQHHQVVPDCALPACAALKEEA